MKRQLTLVTLTYFHSALTGVVLLAPILVAHAQGTRADYERAKTLRERTSNKVFKTSVKPHWLPGNTALWYRNDLSGGRREFILADAVKGERQPAFDHARLAAALAKAIGKDLPADRLPLDKLEWTADRASLSFASGNRWWTCDLRSYELQAKPDHSHPATGLRAEDKPRPSRRTGPETSITFINRTAGDLEVFWITPEGERRRYTTVKAGEQHRQHTFAGHVWLVTDAQGKALGVFEAAEDGGEAILDTGRPAKPDAPEKSKPHRVRGPESPDGRWSAFLKDDNVHVRDLRNGEQFPLSTDGHAEDAYTERLHWSPDSKKLVAIRTRKGEGRKIHFVESSPKDQLQPKLHSFDYAKPGDRIAVPRPQLFEVERRKLVPVDAELFENPWNLSDLRWSPDSKQFTFLYNQRGHQVLRLVAVDAETGATRALVEEQARTFIDYNGKLFVRLIEDTGEILWMSERDGWNHLYLYDAATGQVKNQITKGQWVVRGVEWVDEKQRQIWFRAGGIRPRQDPYFVHYGRINFDGTGLVVLTEGDGTHTVEFSPDRAYLVDTWSRVDQPPVTELRRSNDGALVCELERADCQELHATGWRAPEPFVAKGRDGQTDIFGVIYRPTHFNPDTKYPVIEQIYAGPHSAHVPKAFRALHGPQVLAELGFVLVQIDGMGTSHRSKAFHDVCWKNLGDAGFPDRILWLKAAAAKYPCLDLTRVGIYGGSAGGQNALRALLAHGDFYQVAVADCGCHDNRMDKIWWNELWMGWPIGPHYEDQSNVTQAHKLQGKLLLIVGELDRNVDPASTMQVVHALVKADKDFELLVMPGVGHGAAENPYASRRRQDFFVRHLLGGEPRR